MSLTAIYDQMEAAGNSGLPDGDGESIQGKPVGTMNSSGAITGLMNAVVCNAAIYCNQ